MVINSITTYYTVDCRNNKIFPHNDSDAELYHKNMIKSNIVILHEKLIN